MESQRNIDKELYEACQKKDLYKVKAMLQCGGDPCRMIEGNTTAAIHEAVWNDDDYTNILEAIIASRRVTDINVGTIPNNVTPLLRACYKGNVKCVRLLMENGADVAAKNKVGDGIVHAAVWSGNSSMVEQCLKWNGVDVNQLGDKNKTGLIWACQKGYVDVVHVLLSARADVDLKDDFGYPAAWYARNNKGITELIVNHQEKHDRP